MTLHSQIIGEGQPFIILHGFLGMSDNWKTLGNKFKDAGFQMHLVDQRNHGRSFHDDAFDYDGLRGALRALADSTTKSDLDKVDAELANGSTQILH